MSTSSPKASPCPVCGNEKARQRAELAPTGIYQCDNCGHHYLGLINGELPESITNLYAKEYAGFRPDPVFNQVIREELTRNFVPRIAPPADILDVGCGNGDFLVAAEEAGYQAIGLDISEAAATLCRERGLQADAGDFLTISLDRQFDFITMWDVVEHLPDPKAFYRRASELLKPGGYLVIKTPYAADTTVSMVKLVPKLAGVLLQVPAHIQWFDKSTLQRALSDCGLGETVWLQDRPMRTRHRPKGLKKTVARLLVRTVYKMGRNGNLFVMARKPLSAADAT